MNLTPAGLYGLFAAWLFFVGLCVGSFLNVVIARVPEGLSVVRPRSRCPHCGHQLPWYENIPLLSWVLLRGKCSACKAPISMRYPAIELLTGVLYLACLVRFDWTFELSRGLLLVSLLIPLSFIDLEHWILPLELTLPGIAAGLLTSIPLGKEGMWASGLGATAGFLVFLLLEYVGRLIFRKEALGGGDKYLLALLGAFLGVRSMLALVFLSSFQGAIVGLTLRALTGRAGPAPAPPPPEPPPVDPAAIPLDPNAAVPPPDGLEDEEDDWVPGPSNLPFGPWLAAAGIEVLLLAPTVEARLPYGLGHLLMGSFGQLF